MTAELLQFIFSGLTAGAVYAIVAIGFTLTFAASDVVNFAQGEFVMIGALTTVFLLTAGVPLLAAAPIAVAVAALVGVLLLKLAIQPVPDASPATLIIITIGASILIRGIAGLVFDKQYHSLPAFSGSEPIHVGGATVLPQSLWVLGGALLMFIGLWWFLDRTMFGKAMRASAANRFAAPLVGIDITTVLLVAYAISAALGALAGILVTPITLTRFDAGALLAVKGVSAAIFGGLGSPIGAVAGGVALGLLEALAAGYISSSYKDAVAFIALILMLLWKPSGLMGRRVVDRV